VVHLLMMLLDSLMRISGNLINYKHEPLDLLTKKI